MCWTGSRGLDHHGREQEVRGVPASQTSLIVVFPCNVMCCRWIMRTMTVMAVVATVLSIIPVVSMSSDKDVVKDTYWTYAKATDNSEFYFSISVVVAEAYGPNNTYIDDKFRW